MTPLKSIADLPAADVAADAPLPAAGAEDPLAQVLRATMAEIEAEPLPAALVQEAQALEQALRHRKT